VYVGHIAAGGPTSQFGGEVRLFENAFWDNEFDFARFDKGVEEDVAPPLPEGNLEQRPEFVDIEHRDFRLRAKSPLLANGIGASDFPSFDSPWPLQADEQRTIKVVAERLQQTSGQR
jgi:hypothetical protein